MQSFTYCIRSLYGASLHVVWAFLEISIERHVQSVEVLCRIILSVLNLIRKWDGTRIRKQVI